MNKTGLLKQGLAVLLTLTMSIGPCALGITTAFANTAVASAEANTGAVEEDILLKGEEEAADEVSADPGYGDDSIGEETEQDENSGSVIFNSLSDIQEDEQSDSELSEEDNNTVLEAEEQTDDEDSEGSEEKEAEITEEASAAEEETAAEETEFAETEPSVVAEGETVTDETVTDETVTGETVTDETEGVEESVQAEETAADPVIPETAAETKAAEENAEAETDAETAEETTEAEAIASVVKEEGLLSKKASEETVHVTEVKINTNARTIEVGKTFQLAAWPQPTNAENRNVTWSSSNTAVATVSGSGLVKGVKTGTATITVTTVDGGYTETCKITVKAAYTAVNGLAVNTDYKEIWVGKTFQFAAWPQPVNATDRRVTWSSENPEVATVSDTGLVTGVKIGSARITVKTVDGGHLKTLWVDVGTPVTGVKISTTKKTIASGKSFDLTAWTQPDTAANKRVKWSSSNTAVATVNSNGRVTVGESGTATITATTVEGGFTAQCIVTVGVPVTSVKINTEFKQLAPGRTFQMAAWPQPANATNRAVIWTSSNPAVATVSSTGLVKALKSGSTIITVKTSDGGYWTYASIRVYAPVTSVKINTTARNMKSGTTFQLAAWPQPSYATNKAVTWTSSNPAVATVSDKGLVNAVKTGTANITVKTSDGGYTAACKITVNVPVTSVKINTTARTIEVRKTFQLAAWPQPTNATNKAVTWTSSNPAVVTVSGTGLVKAVKAGTATITVKTVDGGRKKYCKITVEDPAIKPNVSGFPFGTVRPISMKLLNEGAAEPYCTIKLEYDSAGKLVYGHLVNKKGRTCTYRYNYSGNKLISRDEKWEKDNEWGGTVTYTYGDSGYVESGLLHEEEEDWLLHEKSSYEYGSNGMLLRIYVDSYEVDEGEKYQDNYMYELEY